MVYERTFIFHIWAETSCEVWLGWGPLASFILAPGEQHVSFNLGSKMEKHMELSPPKFQFSSVQFSRSVVSDSLWPLEQQHARPSCPSPTPGVHPNPCPLSWRCHHNFSSVQFSSVTPSCPTLCDPMNCSTPGFPVLHCLPEFAQIYVHWAMMPSNHLILSCPLLFLPSIFPSIRVFSNESALLIRWPNYRHFNFNISPSNEHSGLISFRMDWLDLLAVQGTLKSLLNITVQKHQFFGTQLSI